MRLIKTEFTRFFALGFIAGAVLVFGVMGNGHTGPLGGSVVPPAEASTAH